MERLATLLVDGLSGDVTALLCFAFEGVPPPPEGRRAPLKTRSFSLLLLLSDTVCSDVPVASTDSNRLSSSKRVCSMIMPSKKKTE